MGAQWRKENPNPRVHRSSGKLGEPRFPLERVDPRVGIFLSPLDTHDGFYLSHLVISPQSRHFLRFSCIQFYSITFYLWFLVNSAPIKVCSNSNLWMQVTPIKSPFYGKFSTTRSRPHVNCKLQRRAAGKIAVLGGAAIPSGPVISWVENVYLKSTPIKDSYNITLWNLVLNRIGRQTNALTG